VIRLLNDNKTKTIETRSNMIQMTNKGTGSYIGRSAELSVRAKGKMCNTVYNYKS